MKQWFEFKCNNFDTVLFFKVGKFYELFHMDADIGFKELDLIFMKGTKGHSGFPEVSYGKYASMLVAKGYRVARVEQTETPEMMKERNKTASKGNTAKVVSREVCSIMTIGTRTFCHLDDVSLMAAGSTDSMNGPKSLLLCIKERLIEPKSMEVEGEQVDINTSAVVEYGICYVDSVLGAVTLSQFQDDEQRSRLRTMLSSMPPTEVLLEEATNDDNNKFGLETIGAVRLANPQAVIEYLATSSEFPADTSDVLMNLKSGQYFTPLSSGDIHSDDEVSVWPTVLKLVVRGLNDGSSSLVTLAMGGALWYLKRALIDYEVLSLGKFQGYVPSDTVAVAADESSGNESLTTAMIRSGHVNDTEDIFQEDFEEEQNSLSPRYMVLDAVALSNLEILQNNFDKSEKGSLWGFINKCRTAFGKRLLKSWLVKPLFRVKDIEMRSQAVEELLTSFSGEAEMARKMFRTLPDLERLLSRLHTNGSKQRSVNHPDSRAQMYEGNVYNGRKIRDFIDVLKGFETLLDLEDLFATADMSSALLCRVTKSLENKGRFPFDRMKKLLRHFREIFDENQAKRDGTIKPRPGLSSAYDDAMNDSKAITADLEAYLREQRSDTGISDLKFWGNGKDRYQIEVPMNQASRVPKQWMTKSQKKTHRRYWTPYIEKCLASLTAAEERASMAEKDTMRSIFEKFDLERSVWSNAVVCTSVLDGLMSLALVSSSPGYVWADFTDHQNCGSQLPFLKVVQGRHPMLEHSLVEKGSGDFIPNDLSLGISSKSAEVSLLTQESQAETTANSSDNYPTPSMLLLSGPNMGGKSTLLRQTCLLCVLAQLGCRVPATEMSLSPVDRIFTRVGASDKILSGQSTFFVELSETALILKSATTSSLCILDELGRGTSTFDGTAIAHSVVDHLVSTVRCRSLFATHYHSLVDDWAVDPRIKLGHMDCLVQTEENKAEDEVLIKKINGTFCTLLT